MGCILLRCDILHVDDREVPWRFKKKRAKRRGAKWKEHPFAFRVLHARPTFPRCSRVKSRAYHPPSTNMLKMENPIVRAY